MGRPLSDFEREARRSRPSLAGEFVEFILHNKKWWLIPILVCLALLAFLVLFAGTGAAPFIYTLF